MLKYPSPAPEIRCDIVRRLDDSPELIRRTVLKFTREYYDEYSISIPVTVTKSRLIYPESTEAFTVYTLSTRADPQKYMTPHSIENYTSIVKDMMIDISNEISETDPEIVITKCITEKYVEVRKGKI